MNTDKLLRLICLVSIASLLAIACRMNHTGKVKTDHKHEHEIKIEWCNDLPQDKQTECKLLILKMLDQQCNKSGAKP